MARYCVIGEVAYDRTWFTNREKARGHAKGLITEPGCYSSTKPKELFVVKVVDVVRVANPPIEVIPEED